MSRALRETSFGTSGCTLWTRTAWLSVGLLLASCAAGKTAAVPPEAVRSHIYPLPLDNVLAQCTALLQKQGWAVKRAGDVLLTNWQGEATGTLITYRIFGQRIDAGLSAIRAERLVATRSTSFSTDHPVSALDRLTGTVESHPFSSASETEASSESAGTAPPAGAFSSSDMAQASPWVVTQHRRDAELELELQREIDPLPPVAAEVHETPSAPRPAEPPADARSERREPAPSPPVERESNHPEAASPRAERPLAELAGIWEGTFTFRGTVMGSFSGEVAVAVDGRTVQVDDFCPERGGMFEATGANNSAAWQGTLVCPAIPVMDCPAATFTYSFAHATLNESTLTLIAAGTVETDLRCISSSGALSVSFVGQKADYVHIAVSRVKRATSCLWPADWEDFASAGSMAMPDPDAAYLGIIRAKGARLPEIQKLLRHCHQVVLLHGEPVLMKLAATRPHHSELH
jgi:hypothetical protein